MREKIFLSACVALALISAGCNSNKDFASNAAGNSGSSIHSSFRTKSSSHKRSHTVRTTAYSHTEADSLKYGRKNAAGSTLKYGRVRSAAADWSRYPMGTVFKIKGEPYVYEIDDYGSALVGTNTIDLYKPNLRSMRAWGVRHVPIEVLRWGSYERSAEILKGRTHVAAHVRKMYSDIRRTRKIRG